MDGLLVATVMLGLWAAGFSVVASLAWYERIGDRRLAAEVAAAFSV